MNDDLIISEGSLVEVSSDDLRSAAAKTSQLSNDLALIASRTTIAASELTAMTVNLPSAGEPARLSDQLANMQSLINALTDRLTVVADAYELAEIKALLFFGQIDLSAAIGLMSELGPQTDETRKLTNERLKHVILGNPGIARDPDCKLPPYIAALGFPLTLNKTVTQIADAKSVAPGGAADLAKKIPYDQTQIRVERYNMTDGTSKYVVYVTGTRMDETGDGAFGVWDNSMFFGEDTASLEALRMAMADQGIAPGDWVLTSAHSQGAMAADLIASDGTYGIDVALTFGDPVDWLLPEDVTKIDVQHDADPVAQLTAHPPITGGSEESIDVNRDTGQGGLFGISLPSHQLDEYIETGALMDQSADPRLNVLTDPLQELQDAESVTVTEYYFTEPSPTGRSFVGDYSDPSRPEDSSDGSPGGRGMPPVPSDEAVDDGDLLHNPPPRTKGDHAGPYVPPAV